MPTLLDSLVIPRQNDNGLCYNVDGEYSKRPMGEVDEPFYAVVVIAATGTVGEDEPEEYSHDNSVDDVDD